jgi:uncharacterized metal-binding protein YceD (DUF177 family)
MIRIDISGMADGVYEFDINAPAKTIKANFDEFKSDIILFVVVIRLGNRYSAKIKAKTIASMICDRSLIDYEENIECEFDIIYKADTKLFLESGRDGNNDNEIIIREDSKYIDLTQEVLENLALQLPMKRLAPEFKELEIDEIFPEILSERIVKNSEIDDRWSKLKDLKIN